MLVVTPLSPPRGDAQALLLQIARCPVIERCVTGDESPCKSIVKHQWPGFSAQELLSRWPHEHHLPVPWVGHLEEAPLLFLSSNPGHRSKKVPGESAGDSSPPLPALGGHTLADHPALGRPFQAPKSDWTDDQIADKYESNFEVWLEGGTRPLLDEHGKLGKEVPYWKGVKAIAATIFGSEVVPGRDYALTEIVRCKSTAELGVTAAALVCVPRYLDRTLALSPATVIIVLGHKARMAFRTLYEYPDADVVSSRLVHAAGRERRIVFMSPPSAREGGMAKALKYPKRLSANDLRTVRNDLTKIGAGL